MSADTSGYREMTSEARPFIANWIGSSKSARPGTRSGSRTTFADNTVLDCGRKAARPGAVLCGARCGHGGARPCTGYEVAEVRQFLAVLLPGVRVFYYLEDRERTLDSPIEKMMVALETYGADLERDKARQRTYDAMKRKARAGHVTGGRVFGYDNVEIIGPDGRRSHVKRQINPSEADVVRRIFTMTAAGTGLTSIAKSLNDEAVRSPRPQQGRPAG